MIYLFLLHGKPHISLDNIHFQSKFPCTSDSPTASESQRSKVSSSSSFSKPPLTRQTSALHYDPPPPHIVPSLTALSLLIQFRQIFFLFFQKWRILAALPLNTVEKSKKKHWGAEEGWRGDSVQMLVSAAAIQPCCHTAGPPGQTDGDVLWLMNLTYKGLQRHSAGPWGSGVTVGAH